MCGIAGKISFNGPRVLREEIKRMNDKLAHRGPDDEGIYLNDRANVGLGHRRLSIIDLSADGRQPMSNEDGTVWITFNGEIYNFLELKPDLEKKGHKFHSKTDTEVVIHLYEEYGEDCLKFLRGMFAFAIWDEQQQKLFLARDRVGKKPLKYYLGKDFFVFASELKAILVDKAIKAEVDSQSLDYFFAFNHVPAPATGFKNIFKLPAAHCATLENGQLKVRRYWSLNFQKKTSLSYKEAKDKLLELLTELVRLRLMADVPVGVFLSGGIDSSAVVALASYFQKPIKTFSVGFAESGFDERPYARTVADYFQTEHTELEVKPNAIEVFPKLVYAYEEPYADSSALPTYYLSQLTRNYIKVALTGDGGDEAFGGYRRYWYWNWLRYLKKDIYYDIATRNYFKFTGPKERLKNLDDVFDLSFRTFLPDDLLVKMDLAAMQWGLEGRSPFLDHHLLEFAASLPNHWKVGGWQGKIILKEALRKILPAAILHRKKQGFEMPVSAWFRGPLFNWACEILLDQKTLARNYFDAKQIIRLLSDHRNDVKNHGQRIWLLLCFEFWHRIFIDKSL